MATPNYQGQRSIPATGNHSTYVEMQRTHTTSRVTKHSKAEKTKSCGYPSACQVHKASPATKASEVHQQVESLEAPKRAEWGGDYTLVGHCRSHVQQKRGHGPQYKQQHAKTRGPHKGADWVTIQISTQTHPEEIMAPEPRKHTKQLPH